MHVLWSCRLQGFDDDGAKLDGEFSDTGSVPDGQATALLMQMVLKVGQFDWNQKGLVT